MATASFDFAFETIGKLLKSGRLTVPVNQRSYMWGGGHVTNLLQDFDEAISNDVREYFLGTIVIVQQPAGLQSIQDGQQRLATTSILLARLRDRLYGVNRTISADSVDNDFLRSADRETEAMVPHLTLNQQDHDYFLRAILRGPKDGDSPIPPPTRQSNFRLKEASEEIAAFLDEKLNTLRPDAKNEFLLRWVRFIEQSAQVATVTASDEVDAYRIFETMNDRGLKASQADILKNYFFSKSGSRMSEAQAMWASVASSIETLGEDDHDNLVTYLRNLWITKNGPTRERELAERIKATIHAETKTIGFLSEASASVQTYLALSNAKHEKWAKYDASVRKNVETIADHLKVEQIKPLMLAVALYFDADEAAKAFKLFVSWSVRFLVAGGGRGGMPDFQYSARAAQVGNKEITKARELRDAMSKYVPGDAEFLEAFANARVSRPYLARYYLRAIEKTRTADPHPEYVANEDVQDVTLEHVLPISDSDHWVADPEAAELAHRMIGNMVLLRSNQNRDLGNAAFAKKRNVFAESGYYTTRDVATYTTWDMQQIKDRQRKLADTAVKTWTFKFED